MTRCFPKKNSFDFIRYFATVSIMLLHFTGYAYMTMGNADFGAINAIRGVATFFPGVVIFFVMSGFLVTASMEKAKDKKSFLKKRFWRIYPELWICMLVGLALIIIVLRGIKWMDKSMLVWLLAQGIGIANTPNCLKQFATGSMNGALWTIIVQVQFYVFLALAYEKIRKMSFKTWLLIIIPIGIAMNILSNIVSTGNEFAQKVLERTLIPYFLWFAIGMFMYIFWDDVSKYSSKLILSLVAIYVLLYVGSMKIAVIDRIFNFGYYAGVVRALLCGLIVVLLGAGVGFLPKFRAKYDISYEMFLFHWIVLNVLVYFDLYNRIGWIWSLIILFVGTVLLAGACHFAMELIKKHVDKRSNSGV